MKVRPTAVAVNARGLTNDATVPRNRWYLVASATALVLVACASARMSSAKVPQPTPIGRGAGYVPSPRGSSGRANARCASGGLEGLYRAHLELFANRRVVIVPAGIGVAKPYRVRTGRIASARCRYPLRTLDPTGVVEFDRRAFTLQTLFAIWRMRLSRWRLLSFRGHVTAFVDGRRFRGSPNKIRVRAGDEIAVEIGGFIRPHITYRFPRR